MYGVIIAGTHSGCGKTTITLGILAALRKRGIKVQPFKAGPDFIDSGLHKFITSMPSRNLDAWMCGKDGVIKCFNKFSGSADISVIEGVMGMYDGDCSTADLAHLLNLPVVLVVDAYGIAESAGAVVKGFAEFRIQNSRFNIQDSPLNFCGVIFNRTASDRHYKSLKDSVKGIPVLGHLPRNLDFEIPHRHLGLTVAEESPISSENIERLAEAVLRYINVEAILGRNDSLLLHSRKASSLPPKLRQQALPSMVTPLLPKSLQAVIPASQSFSNRPKIAVAYDKAFCFYYEDNLDLLRDAGAEIIRFSPLADAKVPEHVDAVYIGGGYPELYSEYLAGNTPMLKSINEWADSGKPLYAECGGLMYLSQGIHDFGGNFFKMSGIFPFEIQMKKNRPQLGYREVQLKDDCIIGKKGGICKGHEFHYSYIRQGPDGMDTVYALKNRNGERIGDEGYKFKNTLASYIHIHFGSNPRIAENFAAFIREN